MNLSNLREAASYDRYALVTPNPDINNFERNFAPRLLGDHGSSLLSEPGGGRSNGGRNRRVLCRRYRRDGHGPFYPRGAHFRGGVRFVHAHWIPEVTPIYPKYIFALLFAFHQPTHAQFLELSSVLV